MVHLRYQQSLWFHRARIHVEHFPYVAIEILKAMAVHEPMVLGLIVFAAARRNRLGDHFVHSAAAFAGKRYQHLCALGSIGDSVWREFIELWMSQQHHVSFFAHDHAGAAVVAELCIKLEAKRSKEILGL